MASPLSQFEIKKLIPLEFMGYDISFTNSSLAMLTTVILILLFTSIGLKGSAIIPSRGQSLVEISYEFIANMIGDNIVDLGGKHVHSLGLRQYCRHTCPWLHASSIDPAKNMKKLF